MSDATEAARQGVTGVIAALKLDVPAGDVELIAVAVLGLVQVIGGAAQKRATQAGVDAANAITTADQAEAAARNRE